MIATQPKLEIVRTMDTVARSVGTCPKCSAPVEFTPSIYIGGHGYHSLMECSRQCGFFVYGYNPAFEATYQTIYEAVTSTPVVEPVLRPLIVETNNRPAVAYKGRAVCLDDRTLAILNKCGFVYIGEDEMEIMFGYYETPSDPHAKYHVYCMLTRDGVLDPYRCECKDFVCRSRKLGRPCKHLKALMLQVEGFTDVKVAA